MSSMQFKIKKTNHFVLADCNNFYVSCERLFNPRLENQPVIVLSNNDGCVVARSQEAKKIGIKMGEPYFKINELCNQMQVKVYSSNYQLYGDLSQRIMAILSQQAPSIEIYSIDEAFLNYPADIQSEVIFSTCLTLRKTIRKWTGIPMSFGIAPTKTLAKIANDLAKKNQQIGVFNLNSLTIQKEILQNYPIGNIWGIGKNFQERLHGMGIQTGWEFREFDPIIIRNKLGVVGERMLWELRGISCLSLEELTPKKSLTCSRSFGKIITDYDELAEALSTFIDRACIRLRKQQSFANALSIFLETILDSNTGARSHYGMTIPFSRASNDTSYMITIAKQCLIKMFSKNERYKKCGVILLDLIPEDQILPDFFSDNPNPKRRTLMHTIDSLNTAFGKKILFYGAMGTRNTWKENASLRSPQFTRSWKELAIANAK